MAAPTARRIAFRPKTAIRWTAAAFGLIAIAIAAFGLATGFFDGNPIRLYGMKDSAGARVAAVYFSGDMGLRFGMGAHVAPALAARNIPVFGINAPTVFKTRRSQAEVNALVADAIRQAMARSGARKVVLMGQSFGSDILVAGLGALPPGLRAKIEAVVLVVPGQTIYFRADPTGFLYRGTPDADAVRDIRAMTWAPLICIYGRSETDSLCPALIGKAVKVIGLPGGHFLRNDHAKLVETIFAALAPILQHNLGETA